MNIKANKKLGQNFLTNKNVAFAEAAHGEDKIVLEIGPGKGILTEELCNVAKQVIAVEKDDRLYNYLNSSLQRNNLTIINKDFFDCTDEELNLNKLDILIANIPYNLSSKVISWLYLHKLEAVLCLQKEFVEHMLAVKGSKSYSKLSVMSFLSFKIIPIMKVSKKSFFPKPKIDSQVIYIKPKTNNISKEDEKIISLIMQHKKKLLKNAILDSKESLNIKIDDLNKLFLDNPSYNERVFKLSPEKILKITKELAILIQK
ncbi:MAG: 16S rRNA (adenine(1518)-N(6)/adenine(1519)-N(6))-dimethyltransferase RsmA [Candidatus Micrarchaeaceae archaeon]